MASEKQIEANRRNGLLSSGTVTPAGKAISRMNALKTGIDAQSVIIRGEDPAALEELTRNYYERFQPQGQEECDLLDSAIRNSWLLRRLHKTEAEIWNGSIDEDKERGKQNYLQAPAYHDLDKTLDRVHTRIASIERALRVSLETLVKLRKNGVTLPAPPVEEEVQSAAPTAVAETNPISPVAPSLPEPIVPPLVVPDLLKDGKDRIM